MTKKYYCIICKKKIYRQTWYYGTKKCRICVNKSRLQSLNGNFKGGLPKCLDCNKILTGYKYKRCKSCAQKGRNNNIYGRCRLGKLNPNFGKKHPGLNKGHFNARYLDGRTPLAIMIRSLENYKNWRTQIFKRDNYTCQECKQIGYKLEAHHIIPFTKLLSEFLKEYDQFSPIEDKETLIRLAIKWKSFWSINNGKTLCKTCHKIEKYNLKGSMVNYNVRTLLFSKEENNNENITQEVTK